MPIVEPISLNEAKRQIRVEFDDDDGLISGYITAARQWVEGFLNQPLVAPEGGEPPEVKSTWKQALLLIVASWYQSREAGAIPEAAHHLLWLDRNVPT